MIRVATFNILGPSEDSYVGEDQRISAIVKALAENHVEVVCLQEVKKIWNNGRIVHDSEKYFRLQEAYRDSIAITYSDKKPNSQNGEGIVSRFPILEKSSTRLPCLLFGRSCVRVTIDVFGHPLHIISIHLEPPAIGSIVTDYGAEKVTQDQTRMKQLESLSTVINELGNEIPIIIGGDFNLDSGAPAYERWVIQHGLKELYPDSSELNRKTFATHPSPNFDCLLQYRYDHLLVRDGEKISINIKHEGRIFDKQVGSENEYFYGYLSDHCGLYADFELSKKNESN